MRKLTGLLAVLLLSSTTAVAEDHAVGARIGLLGLGLEYSYRLSDFITIRGGLNGSGYSFDDTESGVNYDFDLDFDSLSVGVDVHPMKGAFRVSAGFLQNDSALRLVGMPAGGTYEIDGVDYDAADVGQLRGRIGFDSTAPFLSLGWDFLRDRKIGMALDLGIIDQGAPLVSLDAIGGVLEGNATFEADLAAEQAELSADVDDLDIYPFASFGVVFRF